MMIQSWRGHNGVDGARGLNHYLLEWYRQLTQIRENGLRRSRTPPTHTKCASAVALHSGRQSPVFSWARQRWP